MKRSLLLTLAMGLLLALPGGTRDAIAQTPIAGETPTVAPETQAVSAPDEEAVKALVRQLGGPIAMEYADARKKLIAMGEPARLALTRMLEEGNVDPKTAIRIKTNVLNVLDSHKQQADLLAAQKARQARLPTTRPAASAAPIATTPALSAAASQPRAARADIWPVDPRMKAAMAAVTKLTPYYRRSNENDPTSPIIELRFYGTKVTDDDLAFLADLPELRELDLQGTGITDAGLVHLRSLTQLEGLALEDTKITDTGLANLPGLAQLKHINLERTEVTERRVQQLKQELPQCRIWSDYDRSAKSQAPWPLTSQNMARLLYVVLALLLVCGAWAWWTYQHQPPDDEAARQASLTPEWLATLRTVEKVLLWGLLLVVVLPGLAFGYAWSFPHAVRSYGWVKTPCLFESSAMVLNAHHIGRANRDSYRLEVVYRYEYQGQTYRSTRVKFSNDLDDFDLARFYRRGSSADCYVDPHDPGEAALIPGLSNMMWGLVIWCGVLGLPGLMAWRHVRSNGAKRRRRWRERRHSETFMRRYLLPLLAAGFLLAILT